MTNTNINISKFKFDFFLPYMKKVKDLYAGAMENGGATKFDDGVYSNYGESEYIDVKENNNQISLFVPSTINHIQVDNTPYVQYCMDYISKKYNTSDTIYYNSQGSWYSENINDVEYDDITIIQVNLETINEADIEYFIEIANYIKAEMIQDGVSISINSALAIV